MNECYQQPHPGSLVPTPLSMANLCVRCGVRVWTTDIPLHDEWHAKIEGADQ